MSKIKMQSLAKVVARRHGIRVTDLTSPSRGRYAAYPRFVFEWICREKLGYSTTQIGRFLGGRDHTTVIYGARQAKRLGLVNAENVHEFLEQAKAENETQLNKWR